MPRRSNSARTSWAMRAPPTWTTSPRSIRSALCSARSLLVMTGLSVVIAISPAKGLGLPHQAAGGHPRGDRAEARFRRSVAADDLDAGRVQAMQLTQQPHRLFLRLAVVVREPVGPPAAQQFGAVAGRNPSPVPVLRAVGHLDANLSG